MNNNEATAPRTYSLRNEPGRSHYFAAAINAAGAKAPGRVRVNGVRLDRPGGLSQPANADLTGKVTVRVSPLGFPIEHVVAVGEHVVIDVEPTA